MTSPEAPDAGQGPDDVRPGAADRDGDHAEGQFDAGGFVVDHDVDPPEEEQPTTGS